MRRLICTLIALFLVTASASAHPGRTDANGGHWNNSTGEYHFHHGYPAHQHPNGVCPYSSGSSYVQPGTASAAIIDEARQASAVDLAPGDYGPEAEDDFDTKRDAFASGFEAGIEYSSDSDVRGSAYNTGFSDGYQQGLNEGRELGWDDGYDDGYASGRDDGKQDYYSAGYEDGYADAEAEREEQSSFPLWGCLASALAAFLLGRLIYKRS